jgi:hypothetical protein
MELSMSMDDVLNGQQAAQGTGEVEDQQQQAAEEVHAEAASQDGQSATTAQHSDTERHVPLAALEAERKGRQDWKEKALRLEGQLEALNRSQQSQGTQQQTQQQLDPIQVMEQRMLHQNLNFSERMARKEYGAELVDKAFEKFQELAKSNPTLHQQVMSSADPWDAVVQEYKKAALLEEVGTDPNAYREKVRAELLAELNQTNGSTTAQQQAIPKSLAGARSAATRSAPTFTGPTPFDAILGNK